MSIKPDHWIRRMCREHGMIDPFEEKQVRQGVISFGVSSYPEPSVHKLGRDGAGVPLPRIERPSRLAVSDHGGNVDWVHAVNAELGGLEVRMVEPTPNGPTWWGTG